MSQVLRELAIGMLTAGISTRAVAREFNVHFSNISTSNRPHNHRPRVTTPAQDLHIQHLHLQDCLRPATTASATISLHNQRISAHTVRNRLREAHLHARHPHRGLDLTAVRRHNWLEWANAHIRWRLALWRGVLFTDEEDFFICHIHNITSSEMCSLHVTHPSAHTLGAVGSQHWQRPGSSLPKPRFEPTTSGYKSNALSTRPRMNLGFHCTGQMANSVYSVVWVSGLLMSTLWIEWPMVAVRLWYRQACVMDEHRCTLLMTFQQPDQQPDQLYAKEMCCTAWGK